MSHLRRKFLWTERKNAVTVKKLVEVFECGADRESGWASNQVVAAMIRD